MNALGYVRQSRKSEAGASPEAQRKAIEQYAELHGWTLVDTLEDLGRSGFDPKVKRPGFEAMLRLVESHGIERVIVYKLDRFTRKGISDLPLVQRLTDAGCGLVSVTEPFFDTSSAMGRGIFAMFLSVAEAESEKISERVRAAKEVQRERGSWNGGPVPFGFRSIKGDGIARLVPYEPEAKWLRFMIDRALAGHSIGSIVNALNDDPEAPRPPRGGERWAQASVFGLLRYETLRDSGFVSPEEWLALQRAVAPRKGRKAQEPTLLGGIIRCAHCGGAMGGTTKGEHPNYRCQNHGCTQHATVPLRIVDEIVTERLVSEIHRAVSDYRKRGEIVRGKVLDRLARYWTLRTGGKATAEIIAARDDVNERLRKLREMKLEGDFDAEPDEYRRLRDGLTAQMEKLSGEIDAQLPTPDEVLADDFTETMDFETRRDVIRLLLDVRVTKAPRPGVRFVPENRMTISASALNLANLMEIARHGEKLLEQMTPEEQEAAYDAYADENFVETMARVDQSARS